MAKKQKAQNKNSKKVQQQSQSQPQDYGARRAINHVVQRKKKRVVSLVRMKPLKQRQNNFDLPDYCPKGYSQQQFDLYRQEYMRTFDLTRDDLRQILKINKQDYSPIMKIQLLHRCADGYALGRIPQCPHCFGNTPVYDKNKGNYFCAGYKQGQNFIPCQSYFQRDDLPRTSTWNNNFQQRQRVRIQRTQKKLKNQRDYQINYKINKKQRLRKLRTEEENKDNQSQNDKSINYQNSGNDIVCQNGQKLQLIKQQNEEGKKDKIDDQKQAQNNIQVKVQNQNQNSQKR